MDLTLVVLAAGIGSRYGGLKQMDPVGPSGEYLLDYGVYDALRAGFGRLVFVIREEIAADFEEIMGRRLSGQAAMRTVCQDLADVPPGFRVSQDRKKPWGTGHAVLAAAAEVKGPFAVINADDFYGRRAYVALAGFLRDTADSPAAHAMIGFTLANTLSPHGTVARGICRTDDRGSLTEVVETTDLGASNLEERGLTGQESASMNCWGFKPSLFGRLRRDFEVFVQHMESPERDEFYLPDTVNGLVRSGEATVRVLPSADAWMGMTNRNDRERVVREIGAMVGDGVYPEALWR